MKGVHIERMSLSESFMLTICYKIRLTLSATGGDDDDGDIKVYQMVVKVCIFIVLAGQIRPRAKQMKLCKNICNYAQNIYNFVY